MAEELRFSLLARTDPCVSQLLFSDAYCLGVELRYPDRAAGPRSLSHQISGGCGLHYVSARVMQGGLDLIFDRYGGEACSRLVDISYIKNSGNWREGSVEQPEVSKDAWLGIAADEGLEEVTSLPGTARATVDLRRNRLLIELDGGTGSLPWALIAEGVAAAVVDGKLAGLFLAGFDFSER